MKKEKPVVKYDFKTDALYIVTKKGKEDEFIEVAPGVNVELDAAGGIIGIEILNASKILRGVMSSLSRQVKVAV